MTIFQMPMFPLGSNVFPTQVVPLHIFEERYRMLMADLFADRAAEDDAPTFGVVLIERGRETGGGDVRAAVGTKVSILQAEEFDDGRWGVIVAGVERLDVVKWHEDDPYPVADVAIRDRSDTGGHSLDDLHALLDNTLRVGAELVETDPLDLSQLSVDPLERLDQMSAVAPLTAFDRQRVLEATSTDRQIAILMQVLSDKYELLVSERDRRASE